MNKYKSVKRGDLGNKMVSKITFLGTAGDSFVAGKQIRASGGTIIKVGESQLHIDPGAGALVKAIENDVNLRANTAILVSNNYLINCNDVNAVIDAMTYGGLDKKGVLVANKTIISGTEEVKSFLTNKHANDVEKIITVNPGQKIGIEEIEINVMDASADDPNAVGFKVITNDFILGYSSDTKYSREIAKQYRGCDIIVLNVTFPGSEKEGNHLNSEDAIKFIREVNPRLAIIKNFGIQMIKADPLYEGREIQKQTGIKVVVAKDGMSLTPDSYSAESRQKRLNMFKNQETGEVVVDKDEATEKVFPKKVEENNEPESQDHQEHLSFE